MTTKNCLDDEYLEFVEELLNEFDNTDYYVMMEKLSDGNGKEHCKNKYNEIREMIENMFE